MKQAIVVVSFGTSYAETRAKTIDVCEEKIFDAFPHHARYRAFTSKMIIKKLRERDGILVPTPEELFTTLAVEGFDKLRIQPLHLLPGEEFHKKIVYPLLAFRETFSEIRLGTPLFSSSKDYLTVIDGITAMLGALDNGEAAVLMGHGTSHPSNMAYPALQNMIDNMGLPCHIATVEGHPTIDAVIPELKKHGYSTITLLPLMLVAGDHARNDMAGEHDGSWKNCLQAAGFSVKILMKGLGEESGIQEIFVRHALDASLFL